MPRIGIWQGIKRKDKVICKKMMAISSGGGHWIQLNRLKPFIEKYDTFYVTVDRMYHEDVEGARFFVVQDVTRWDRYKWFVVGLQVARLIIREKPDIILTTGAAPGLVAVLLGFIFRKKTIWLDSVANVEKISGSGRIASRFVSCAFTQWKHLEDKRVRYGGRVF